MHLKANLKSRIIANSQKIIQNKYSLCIAKETRSKSNENQKKLRL